VATVQAAHASLKTATVTLAEGKVPGRTVRQGEWFFVNPAPEELAEIAAWLGGKRGFIKKKEPIGTGGHPHVADELVQLPSDYLKLEHGYTVQGHNPIYVRGAIKHQDHATVSFKSWRRVIRNNEGGATQTGGIRWID
jgi:hypothetical protein